jgi:hypothetical protein
MANFQIVILNTFPMQEMQTVWFRSSGERLEKMYAWVVEAKSSKSRFTVPARTSRQMMSN